MNPSSNPPRQRLRHLLPMVLLFLGATGLHADPLTTVLPNRNVNE